jgi:hypothetical protein
MLDGRVPGRPAGRHTQAVPGISFLYMGLFLGFKKRSQFLTCAKDESRVS